MIHKFAVFCFALISTLSFSQAILERYPEGQNDYIGGNVAFYKEFHQILLDRNIKPCENKDEVYTLRLLVTPEKTIKYIKEEDAEKLKQKKCTYDLAREVVKYMKNWNPAIVDGNKVSSLTSFLIVPDHLFENYTEGYDPVKISTDATYQGGFNEFRKKVSRNIDLSRFAFNGVFKLEVTFTIGTEGDMSDVQISQSSGLADFDRMIISSVKSIRNKWTPAKIRNIALASKFRLPLNFQSR